MTELVRLNQEAFAIREALRGKLKSADKLRANRSVTKAREDAVSLRLAAEIVLGEKVKPPPVKRQRRKKQMLRDKIVNVLKQLPDGATAGQIAEILGQKQASPVLRSLASIDEVYVDRYVTDKLAKKYVKVWVYTDGEVPEDCEVPESNREIVLKAITRLGRASLPRIAAEVGMAVEQARHYVDIHMAAGVVEKHKIWGQHIYFLK